MLMEALGICAMVLILGAYAFSRLGYLSRHSSRYQALNFVGSAMFVVYLSVKNAWASVALNAIWATIALIVLVRRWFTSATKKQEHLS